MADKNFGCKLDTPSVLNLFSSGSNSAFVIPSYQREFRWDTEKSGQLMSDIYTYYNITVNDYVNSMQNGNKEKFDGSNKFVGTLIAVDGQYIAQKKARNMSLIAVIDGQQRLTTFVLLLISLYMKLSHLKVKIEEKVKSIDTDINLRPNYKIVLRDIDQTGLNNIRTCLVNASDLPRFGREQDNWHHDDFVSAIPLMIKSCVSFNGEIGEDVTLEEYLIEQVGEDKISATIKDSFYMIGSFLDIISVGLNKEQLPLNLAKRWSKYQLHMPADGLEIGYICNYSGGDGVSYSFEFDKLTNLLDVDSEVSEIARLLSFANFFLNNVYVANVICQPNNYLDIFESLNTAGSPLTPIETFVPEVFQFYEKTDQSEDYLRKKDIKISQNSTNDKCYSEKPGSHVSPEGILNAMQVMIDRNQIKNSAKMVVSFSLINSGEKCPEIPQGQRLYLKRSLAVAFEDYQKKAEDVNLNPVKKYLYVLYETVRWWCLVGDTKNYEKFNSIFSFSLDAINEREIEDQAKFSLLVLREAKLTLAQSIACRFYIQFLLADKKDNQKITYLIFLKVLRALAAFSAFWLTSSSESTNGVEEVFRDVLAGVKYGNEPLVTGYRIEDKGNVRKRIPGKAGLITEQDVIERLHKALKTKFKKFSLKDWQRMMLFASPAKRVGISRMLILTYLHNSIPEGTTGLRGQLAANSRPDKYMSYDAWRNHSGESYDIEHVMPQTLTENWRQKIDNPELENQIVQKLGNVTLLPKEINRYLQNSTWDQKHFVYSLVSEKKPISDYPKWLTGQFKPKERDKFEDWLKKPIQDPIAEFVKDMPDWDEKFIDKRTIRMSEVIWNNLSDFLDLSKFGEAKSLSMEETSALGSEKEMEEIAAKTKKGKNAKKSSKDDGQKEELEKSSEIRKGGTELEHLIGKFFKHNDDLDHFLPVFEDAVATLTKNVGLSESFICQNNEFSWHVVDKKDKQRKIILSADNKGVQLIIEKFDGSRLKNVKNLPFYKDSKQAHKFTLTEVGQLNKASMQLKAYMANVLNSKESI